LVREGYRQPEVIDSPAPYGGLLREAEDCRREGRVRDAFVVEIPSGPVRDYAAWRR
jgi:hypothetical protein